MQGIINSLVNAFNTLMTYIPSIIGALVILLIGYIIAKIVKSVIVKLLRRAKVDDRLKSGETGDYVERFSPQGSPARLVGTVVFAVLMFFVVSAAIGALRIPALTQFMNQVLAYLPNVIAALLILLIAVAIAGAVGGLAQRMMGDTFTGRIVRTAGPALIMAIAVFMVLTQLGIARVIVVATYIALIGALALGCALAFGLGGREAAGDMINNAYRRAQAEQETVKADAQRGRERAQADAQRARERARQEAGTGAEGGSSGSTQDDSYRTP